MTVLLPVMDDSNHSTSEFILNHVFLPSKLPQEEDPKRHVKEVELLTVLTKGAEEFAAQLKSISHISSEPSAKAWTILIRMLHSLRLLHEGLSEPVLEHALANLEVNGSYYSSKSIHNLTISRCYSSLYLLSERWGYYKKIIATLVDF